MNDLIFAYIFEERAFSRLSPVEDQAMWIEGLNAFKLLLRCGQGLKPGEALLIEARIAETEKRRRRAPLLAKCEVESASKDARARVDDQGEILDQIAIRFRRNQRRKRQILQHAIRRDAEGEVLIEMWPYRGDQQPIQLGRLAVELFEWRARAQRFQISRHLIPQISRADI